MSLTLDGEKARARHKDRRKRSYTISTQRYRKVQQATKLDEARCQEGNASIVRLYAYAEKLTGLSTAERVAIAAQKRVAPPCPNW